jgi:hypothetical protein
MFVQPTIVPFSPSTLPSLARYPLGYNTGGLPANVTSPGMVNPYQVGAAFRPNLPYQYFPISNPSLQPSWLNSTNAWLRQQYGLNQQDLMGLQNLNSQYSPTLNGNMQPVLQQPLANPTVLGSMPAVDSGLRVVVISTRSAFAQGQPLRGTAPTFAPFYPAFPFLSTQGLAVR